MTLIISHLYSLSKDILSDRSLGKIVSHGRLVGFLNKHKFNGLIPVYTKPQLTTLCKAYGISQISSLNKSNLAQRLAAVVVRNRGMIVPGAVDSRQYTVVNSEMDPATGRVCLRLSAVPTGQPRQPGTCL